MADPRTYQFNLTGARPTDASFPETWYPGIQQTWAGCTTQRAVHPIDGIKAVVIHATAGGSSSGAVSVMTAGAASFHWLVPDENEPQHGNLVWACAPETLAAWHVRNDRHHADVNDDRRRVNHWSLGIEVVNTQIGTTDAFSDWQVAVTAKIVRYCWAKYPNLRHIVSHAKLDPDRRRDPGSHFPWERFKDLVLSNAEPSPFIELVGLATNAAELALPAEAAFDEVCK
jgi:N-acetyl-anhydromuramyl-L-alanine amidase AmpD